MAIVVHIQDKRCNHPLSWVFNLHLSYAHKVGSGYILNQCLYRKLVFHPQAGVKFNSILLTGIQFQLCIGIRGAVALQQLQGFIDVFKGE